MKSHNRFLLDIVVGGILVGVIQVNTAVAQTVSPVQAWEEMITIPTYLAGPPDPNPMFYLGRTSQGAEGRIYPYPLYDNLTEEKEDRGYRIVYLENEYLKIGILPEIGGRLFSGVDKTNGYDFIYRQNVIKPALIGLIGAWISGGIEWNIPHHHRATTFIPVQHRLEDNADGGKTIWVGELEIRHRTRWAVGYTLKPGKAYLEAAIRILNRTPLANTMLAFANVAVHTNEDYQIIFPPSTQYVTHHHKREFTTWPIATTAYGGADFSAGVDVSWYRNHYRSNSMFAWNYEDDFFAGYDHGRQAGTMSVADHHAVPGKKFWTWGNGPGGRMWDGILTDEDGPYIELMTGAYSDNQPDYSWLQPYQAQSVEMYWYPFRDIGGVKNANLEAAVNLEVADDGAVTLGFYTTSAHPAAAVLLEAGEELFLQEVVAIDPGSPFVRMLTLPAGVDEHDLRASIAVEGRELIAYSPARMERVPMPPVVGTPPPPEEMRTVEELFLTGQRIDQFHHPTLDPEPYWEEALRRDPGDTRVNNAMGILALRRGLFREAEGRFRKALERLTADYTAPKDAEPLYYLGVALKAQGRNGEAFDTFSRAAWSAHWRDAAHFSLAELSVLNGDLPGALRHAERSIEANALNIRALNLEAAVLRHLGRADEALRVLEEASHRADPLDVRLMVERWLASGDPGAHDALLATLRDHPATGLETAAEYLSAGLWEDGAAVLGVAIESAPNESMVSPLVHYYLAVFSEKLGDEQAASEHFRLGMQMSPDYVFPFQHEAIAVLRRATEVNPEDARARYYLGNLLFDWQPEEAVRLWQESATLDPFFPIVHRNLAVALSEQDEERALAEAISRLETAVTVREPYPLHFVELDRLYQITGTSPETRLAMLDRNHASVIQRDDATGRLIDLQILMGNPAEAIELMSTRIFDIWEQGVGFNAGRAWTDAHLLCGRQLLEGGRPREALDDFEGALRFPPNLRVPATEGPPGRQAEVSYWIGMAREALGDADGAREAWQGASAVQLPPWRRDGGGFWEGRAIQHYHQAMAMVRLGREEGEAIFRELQVAAAAAAHRLSTESLPSSSVRQHRAQLDRIASAHYLAGLGHLGLGEVDQARARFEQALKARPDHMGARTAIEAWEIAAHLALATGPP